MKTNIITRCLLFIPRKIFIAGSNRQEALAIAAKLNKEGFGVTIDILGEHSKKEKDAESALKEYKQLVDDIAKHGLKATVSIKLTHLGLELGFGYCFNAVRELLSHARQNKTGVEFDMEEFKFNPNTIEIFQGLSKDTDGNRICLQANIKNSFENLDSLHDQGYQARLVRGAYEEASDVSFYYQRDIQENFMSLINVAILKTIMNKLDGIEAPRHAIASRDKKIINYTRLVVEANWRILKKSSIEFQLLFGYLGLGRELLRQNYPVRIYLPYGDDSAALPYLWRRLKTPHAWKLLIDWLVSFGKTRHL